MLTPSTGGTAVAAEQYDVSLIIPGADASHPALHMPTIAIVGSQLRDQGIDALIGRDILGSCVLTYNGSMGFYTLAY